MEQQSMEDPLRQELEPADPPLKQSGLGIASFIIAIVAILAFIGLIMSIAVNAGQLITPDGTMPDPEAIGANAGIVIAGLLVLAALGLSVVGLILGIVGLFMKNRRKVFGIIGVVLNAFVVLGFGALLVFSLLLAV